MSLGRRRRLDVGIAVSWGKRLCGGTWSDARKTEFLYYVARSMRKASCRIRWKTFNRVIDSYVIGHLHDWMTSNVFQAMLFMATMIHGNIYSIRKKKRKKKFMCRTSFCVYLLRDWDGGRCISTRMNNEQVKYIYP